MKNYFPLGLMLIVFASLSCHLAQAQGLQTIPAVASWKPSGGKFTVDSPTIIYDEKYTEELRPLAEILKIELKAVIGQDVPCKAGDRQKAKGNIFLSLGEDKLPEEAYELEIKQAISIKASSSEGAFYGTRTLLQLLSQNPRGLDKGLIRDQPKYAIRSILLDVGRKFIPFEELKDWVRALSYFKFNEIHLHLNDNAHPFYGAFRVEMKTIPGLTSKDGFYTQEQIRELQDFAKQRGMQIVPEVDSPSHARAFTTVRPDLAHPKLGGNYLDITKKDTYTFMEKVFDEIVPLFDSPYFHIGTDEYRLSVIKDEEEKEKLGELFRKYINHFNDYVRAKGKISRIWSGYEHMPGTTEPDKSIVIDMWETSDATNKSKLGYQFINSTHFWTYLVPGAPYYGVNNEFLYNEWTPLKFSNKPEGQLTSSDPGLLGGKLHVWNDKGPTGFTTNEIARITMPTVLVMSEKLWGTKSSENYEAFAKRAKEILPGDPVFAMIRTSHSKQKEDEVFCGQIPGTEFLARKGAVGGMVWQSAEPKYFIANINEELELAAEDLEYPWTATFTVTRNTDIIERWEKRPAAHEALLTSDLATLYLDYTFEERDDKTKFVTGRKQGVGIVRAIAGQAPTPESHVLAEIHVFDYAVPLEEKVKLTMVGYQNKTELYVNGELVDTIDKQMVCPIKNLGGNEYIRSFHGVLHDAAIYDYADPSK